jgi:hypothetical protein
MYGPPRLAADLREIGYEPEEVHAPDGTPFIILKGHTVPCGRFAGRVIDLAIQGTPDYPRTVASAIHVRAHPQLLDFGDTQPGVRNITSSALGPAWRYWSQNFNWRGDRGARRLMSQINRVFENA